jgi:1-acyl-sn-glycerol-3-phosphate acyltransferase
MSFWAARVLESLGIELVQSVPLPRGSWMGFSNHQSWLDILVLGACCPSRFISKDDVAHFPIIGPMAKELGTVFVRRGQPLSDVNKKQMLDQILGSCLPVMCFPEGTTHRRVGKLKRGVIEFSESNQLPAVALYLDYDQPELIAWLNDDALVPHIWRLIFRPDQRPIKVRIGWQFCKPQQDLRAQLNEFYKSQSEVLHERFSYRTRVYSGQSDQLRQTPELQPGHA